MKNHRIFSIIIIALIQIGLGAKLPVNKIGQDPNLYSYSFIGPVSDTINIESFVKALEQFDFSETDNFIYNDKSFQKMDITAIGDQGFHAVHQLFPDLGDNEIVFAISNITSNKNQSAVLSSVNDMVQMNCWFDGKTYYLNVGLPGRQI